MSRNPPEKQREYSRRYREANREQIRERERSRRAANREQVNEAARRRYAANPEKHREQGRRYHAANRERELARKRRYREANREELRERDRRRYADDPEAAREQTRRWRAANLDQAREGYRLWREANLQRERDRERRYHAANRDRDRYNWLRDRHDWTPEGWAAKYVEQDGRCYLCRRPLPDDPSRIDVDHDHRCPHHDVKKSCRRCRRGLACDRCNTLIGLADDDPDLLHLIADDLAEARARVGPLLDEPGQPTLFDYTPKGLTSC
jgi:hypothetical protein